MDQLSSLLKTGSSELGLTEFFISIVFSLVAGIIVMFLYRLYFHNTFDRNESLTKSFVIIAPSISAVFWAIQFSLPLSLGLLGALSFVRFRTPIKKPEDIGFILLVIALSLLSSVFRFYAAGILLGVIAVVIFVKSVFLEKAVPFVGTGSYLTAFLTTTSSSVEDLDVDVRGALVAGIKGLKAKDLTLNDVVQKDDGYSLRYSIYVKTLGDNTVAAAIGALGEIESLERVEVFNGRVA